MDPTIERLIAELRLAPHPEGGHYRRVHESAVTVEHAGHRRPALTAIQFLLAQDEASRWHRVDADETWHWQDGGALELQAFDMDTGRLDTMRLDSAVDRRCMWCGQGVGNPHGRCPVTRWSRARWRRVSYGRGSHCWSRAVTLKPHCDAQARKERAEHGIGVVGCGPIHPARHGTRRATFLWGVQMCHRSATLFSGVSIAFTVAFAGPAGAQGAPAPSSAEPPIRDLAPLVVSGIQPGPGLWKVRRGENTLWILGTVSPLPRRMEWESRDVEKVIAQSQEFIEPPGARIDAELGFFGKLALAPKAFGARKNPDGQTLQQVVPPNMYARWLVLKHKYMGDDRSVEFYRPILAAMELYKEAIEDAGLRQGGVVWPGVERLAKRHDVPRTETMVTVMIQDPKVALNEFRSSKLEDLDCFAKTLDRLESDLGTMRERANAWAVGDLEALKSLPYTDQNEACLRAAAQSGVLRKRTGDIEGQMAARWIGAAEAALAKNRVTFSVLPMRELVKPDGFVAKLKAKGYAVEEPQAVDAAGAVEAADTP